MLMAYFTGRSVKSEIRKLQKQPALCNGDVCKKEWGGRKMAFRLLNGLNGDVSEGEKIAKINFCAPFVNAFAKVTKFFEFNKNEWVKVESLKVKNESLIKK